MRQVSTLHFGHPGTESGSFLLGTIGLSKKLMLQQFKIRLLLLAATFFIYRLRFILDLASAKLVQKLHKES